MNKKLKFLACGVVALSLSLSTACLIKQTSLNNHDYAQASQLNYTTKTFDGFIFNTSYNASISADFNNDSSLTEKFTKLSAEVEEFILDLENSISASVPNSSVYAFNEANVGERVEIDKTAYTVLSLAKNMYEFTEGYYNPAVYYCVDLYGFAPRSEGVTMPYDRVNEEETGLPEQKYVTAFQQLSQHFKDVEIEQLDGKYYATKPQNAFVEVDGVTYNLKVDLGGIGKGYAVDVVEKMFDEYGFEYGYFSFGTSSLFAKKYFNSQDNCYNLGITNPRGNVLARGNYVQVRVKDSCISTSGDYEKYYIIDDVRYSHLINPYTGAPIQTGIMSATIIGKTSAEGDALTTALCAMSIEKAVDFINNNLKDSKVIIAYNAITEGQIIANFSDYTVTNTVYVVRSSVDENGNIVYPSEITLPGGNENPNEDKNGCNSSIVGGQSAFIISLTLPALACVIVKKGKKCQ